MTYPGKVEIRQPVNFQGKKILFYIGKIRRTEWDRVMLAHES